ncbi:MAG: hypothetical protein IJC84_03870 [Clostridia bacterium]|nr:hypothetical protein [Clostridia bacterium]
MLAVSRPAAVVLPSADSTEGSFEIFFPIIPATAQKMTKTIKMGNTFFIERDSPFQSLSETLYTTIISSDENIFNTDVLLAFVALSKNRPNFEARAVFLFCFFRREDGVGRRKLCRSGKSEKKMRFLVKGLAFLGKMCDNRALRLEKLTLE